MTLEQQPASADEREAFEFLARGRKLRGLSPLQFRRIERLLEQPSRPRHRKLGLPALAALGLAFVTGTAVAHVMDLSRLPLIGPLFTPAKPTLPAEPSRPAKQPRRPVLVAPSGQGNPTAPPAAQPVPDVVVTPPAAVAPTPVAPPAPRTGEESARPLSRAPQRRAAITEAKAPVEAPQDLTKLVARADAEPTPVASSVIEPQSFPDRAPMPAPPGDAFRNPESRTEVYPGERIQPDRARPAAVAAATPVASTVIEAQPVRPAAAVAPEDPITAESRSFSTALAEWHRDHNAKAALAVLDLHERRFPRGQMQLEARLLRAEIFLKQGHEREALGVLDQLPLVGLPRGRELQTVRGELRTKYGRCAEGRNDLTEVLAKGSADALGRRAARSLQLCP